jgi:hypothetical protein
MIEYLASSAEVLAVKVRNGLSRAEMDGLIERLQSAIGKNPKTHVFVDIDRFRAKDWFKGVEALPRSLGLMRLDRYGRIAIVSDDHFVRGWSRFESAILPRLRYEIFHSRERDRALQWVEGKVDEAHEAALQFLETNNPLVLAYAIDGTLAKADLERAIQVVRPRLARELGPISVLARIGEIRFSEPADLIDERYIRFKKETLSRVERYAVIGGPRWLEMTIKAMAPIMPFELRYFGSDEEPAAWDWVGAREAGKLREVAVEGAKVPA